MKITINPSLDLIPQLHLHIKLARQGGRSDTDILTDVLDTIDHTEDELAEARREAYSDGYDQGLEDAEPDDYSLSPKLCLNEDTGNDLLNAINKFRNGISQDRPEELSHCETGLRRGTALYMLATAIDMATFTMARSRIHKAFGAPGNYGYGTKAGDALLAIYEATEPQIAAFSVHMATSKPEPINSTV